MSTRSIVSARAVAVTDFPELRSLFARVWGEPRSEAHDRMRFLETFDGLPVASVATSGNECTGYFMFWPMELTDGRRIVRAGQAMDVMTDPRSRGKGVFPELAKASAQLAAERGLKLAFGIPNDAIFETYLKRLSWAQPTEIVTLVRPLSFNGLIPGGGLANSVLRLFPQSHIGSIEVRTTRPDDHELKEFLDKARKKTRAWRVHRTTSWYDFRFQSAGMYDYRWCTIWRDGCLAAFSLWAAPLNQKDGPKRANLAELVGLDEVSSRLAVAAAIQAARTHGANFMVAALTGNTRLPAVRSNGFLPYRRKPIIARTFDADSFDANPFTKDGWDLFGADFDFF